MKRLIEVVICSALACSPTVLSAQGARTASGIPHCSPAAFLLFEQGKLAAVDWVEYTNTQVHTRSILTQSRVIDATIDLRADGTASHVSVVLTNAGGDPGKPINRDLQGGATYLSDMIVSSLEQAVARARVLDLPIAHVAATSLYRDSLTDVLARRIDTVDWVVTFRDKTYQVLTDENGCMQAATMPEYGIVIERRTGFSPSRYPLWPPYSGPPDGAYTASEAKIATPEGQTLAGTLSSPRANGRVPAAILITGLGPAERNGGAPPWMPLRDIADAITRQGMAVLRVDDRGIGESTGNHAPSTTFDEAADVRTEITWLRSQPGIDPRRIVLVGYSEGSTIASMIAADDPQIAGIVSLDGSGVPGPQLAREQIEQAVMHDASIAAQDRAKEIEKQLNDPLTPRERVFLTIDPLVYASRVRCPALVLQGGSDITVPARSAEKIASAIRGNGNADVTVRIVPAVSHSLLPDPIGAMSGWVYLPAFETSPEVLDTIKKWLAERFSVGSKRTP